MRHGGNGSVLINNHEMGAVTEQNAVPPLPGFT